MKHTFDDSLLTLRQLEASLADSSHLFRNRPRSGWIAEFRKAMLMTASHLAKKIGIERSVLSRLEKSEVNNTITLASLNRAADALGCELRYVFVPKKPLEKELFDRAKQKLQKEDKRLQHTLNLEGQGDYNNQLQFDIRAAALLHELGSKIWDD